MNFSIRNLLFCLCLTQMTTLSAAGGPPDMRDEETRDSNGNTSLHLAMLKADSGSIEDLITKTTDINATNKLGKTPLHLAAETGHLGSIMTVLRVLESTDGLSACNFDAKDKNGNTPLHLAVLNGHATIVDILLGTGRANANIVNNDGKSPLDLAKANNQNKIIEYLTSKAEKISASRRPTEEAARRITAESKEADKADDVGNIAARFETIQINAQLEPLITNLKAACNQAGGKDSDGNTPLHLAMQLDLKKMGLTQKDLLSFTEKKEDFCAVNAEDETPLHFAIYYNQPNDIIEWLIDNGSDKNAVNTFGETPLHSAAMSNKLDAVKLLVNKGANINAINNGELTALDLTFEGTICEDAVATVATIATFLIKNGATGKAEKLNRVLNAAGETLLHLAVRNGDADLVKLLVARGADIDTLDKDGETPLELAEALQRDDDMLKLLETKAQIDAIAKRCEANGSARLEAEEVDAAAGGAGREVIEVDTAAAPYDNSQCDKAYAALLEAAKSGVTRYAYRALRQIKSDYYLEKTERDGNKPYQLAKENNHDVIVAYVNRKREQSLRAAKRLTDAAALEAARIAENKTFLQRAYESWVAKAREEDDLLDQLEIGDRNTNFKKAVDAEMEKKKEKSIDKTIKIKQQLQAIQNTTAYIESAFSLEQLKSLAIYNLDAAITNCLYFRNDHLLQYMVENSRSPAVVKAVEQFYQDERSGKFEAEKRNRSLIEANLVKQLAEAQEQQDADDRKFIKRITRRRAQICEEYKKKLETELLPEVLKAHAKAANDVGCLELEFSDDCYSPQQIDLIKQGRPLPPGAEDEARHLRDRWEYR